MSWAYMAARDEHDEWWVHEVYFDTPMGIGWTEEHMKPYGATREELLEDLKMMYNDLLQTTSYIDLEKEEIVDVQLSTPSE